MHIASFIAIVLCNVGSSFWCDSPFDDAAYVPSNVHYYVHIENGAVLREKLSEQSLGTTFTNAFEKTVLEEAWRSIADAADVSEGELFDHLLGKKLTFAIRRLPEGKYEWGAISIVDKEAWTEFERHTKLQLLKPHNSITIRKLSEQDLLFARKGNRVVIGPDPHHRSGLFYDLVTMAVHPEIDSLSTKECIRKAKDLGNGDMGLMIQHQEPLGGWSAAVLDFRKNYIRIQHLSEFKNSPFGTPRQPVDINSGYTKHIREGQVVTLTQPMNNLSGALAIFLRTRLPQNAITERMRKNFGERYIFLVGESSNKEANQQNPLHDKQIPCFAIAIEVNSTEHVIVDLDQFMTSIVHAIGNAESNPDLKPKVVHLNEIDEDEIRYAELGHAARKWLLPNFKALDGLQLHWTTASGLDGNWWVIATTKEYAADTRGRLATAKKIPGKKLSIAGQLGYLNGQMAVPYLARFTDYIRDHADPGDAASATSVMSIITDIAGNFETIRWKSEVPAINQFRSFWIMRLKTESEDNARKPDLRAGNNN